MSPFISRLRRILLLSALAGVALAALYLVAVVRWTYSDGERAGWLQKFSRKGWVCKTWEGELAMVTLPGATPEKFLFTVPDEAVAAQLLSQVGARVRLHYGQHRGVPTTCLGDTEYWVDAVLPEAVQGPATTPAPGAAGTAGRP
jgi:hypothetical protein